MCIIFVNVAIYGQSASAESTSKEIKKILDNSGVNSFAFTKSKQSQADFVIVLGGDRGVRNYFHHAFDPSLPVLGIGEAESEGFLAQIDRREFASYVGMLKKRNYTVEEVPRLGVKIDGKSMYFCTE